MKAKKRLFHSSDLVKVFQKSPEYEYRLFTFQVKDFLESKFSSAQFKEIHAIDYKPGILSIKVGSPLFRNDLRMQKKNLLTELQIKFPESSIVDLLIL